MAGSGAPGVKTWATPMSFRTGMSASGMMPPDEDQDVGPALLPQPVDDPGDEGQMGPGQEREPDGVGVLLDHRLDDLVGGLVQAGVDDFEARVPQGPGDHLGPPVVAVEARLGHHHAVRPNHGAQILEDTLEGVE